MLKDSFCSSPWFHVRKTYDGSHEACRWANKNASGVSDHTTSSLLEFYNGDRMRELRSALLKGERPPICETCYYQDSHGKLSGRPRQLLKSGIQIDEFEIGMLSSPHFADFNYSWLNQGESKRYPVDLQIDLGKTCNSACIMCTPSASSRLELEYQKLSTISPALFPEHKKTLDWTRDQEQVDAFVTELTQIPDIKYIHFLGGETLFNSSFYQICEALIENGIARNTIIGTTTNGTIYDARIENLITEFKEFHLGVSVDANSSLNDYIRWPSKIDQVRTNLEKFIALRDTHPGLTISARITPNLFTMYEFSELAEYLFELDIVAESCNILYKPECLRIELMPDDIRTETIEKLEQLVAQKSLMRSKIYNTRRSDLRHEVLSTTVVEYLDFVKNFSVPNNVDAHRYDLVQFLKAFETLHQNSIIDHAPRYTDFLRSYGY